MRYSSLAVTIFLLLSSGAYADSGLVSIKSAHSVKKTADRLESALKAKGMKVFNRIDHAKGAKSVNKTLRPTELIIFGNPKIGTVLMQCKQSVGIDLPQKALVWKDSTGQVWLSYNNPNYVADRHHVKQCGEVIKKIMLRSPTGRAMVAVRDSETSAQSMGIHLAYTKGLAFAISAAFTGLAGGLFAHKISYLAPDGFTLIMSIQLLLMVVVGGLGSMHGVIFGAFFIGLLPQGIAIFRDSVPPTIAQIPGLEPGIFGLILVLFLIYEPLGIYGRWCKIRLFFEEFPLYRKATYKKQKSYLRTERLR